MFWEKARAWSMKFFTALESTRAVETTHEEQPASEIGTKKGLAESDDGILTPSLGEGRSLGYPSALVDPGLGRTGTAEAPPGRNRNGAPAVSGNAALPQRGAWPLLQDSQRRDGHRDESVQG